MLVGSIPVPFLLCWWTYGGSAIFLAWTLLIEKYYCLSCILIFAELTKHMIHVPNNAVLACILLSHIILLGSLFVTYAFDNGKRNAVIGGTLFALIPNYYHPYHVSYLQMFGRLLVFTFVVNGTPDKINANVHKHIRWAWILFANEACLILVPFQVIYDTYKYEIDTIPV